VLSFSLVIRVKELDGQESWFVSYNIKLFAGSTEEYQGNVSLKGNSQSDIRADGPVIFPIGVGQIIEFILLCLLLG
jgi:hypothetical protein